MKYDGIQARNQAANLFYQAAEEAPERPIRQAVRAIGDTIMSQHAGVFTPDKARALERLGQSIREYAQLGLPQVIQNYEERVQALLRAPVSDAKGGSKMGLFSKILGKKEKADSPEVTQHKMEIDIFDLEQQYEKYLDLYKKDHRKYDELAQRAAGLDKSSFDYELIVREARSCCKSMEQHRSMMEQVYQVLETNRDAFEAIAGGKTLAALKRQMPDAAQIAVMLEGFADAVEEMRNQQADIQEAVQGIGKKFFSAAPSTSSAVDDAFNAKVDRLKSEKKAQDEAEARAREAAEAAARAEAEAREKALAEEKQRAQEQERQQAAEEKPEGAVLEAGAPGTAAAE